MTDEKRKQLLADRVRAASEINPETAEVLWCYVNVRDPYDIYDPEEGEVVGRGHFARRPGGTWVCFYDLPDATRDWQLGQKHHQELVFPAGLLAPRFG